MRTVAAATVLVSFGLEAAEFRDGIAITQAPTLTADAATDFSVVKVVDDVQVTAVWALWLCTWAVLPDTAAIVPEAPGNWRPPPPKLPPPGPVSAPDVLPPLPELLPEPPELEPHAVSPKVRVTAAAAKAQVFVGFIEVLLRDGNWW
jgi:hypothetical protein